MPETGAAFEIHEQLWDWRRQVADLYAAIRGLDSPRVARDLWRRTRDELFRDHPQSPLDAAARAGFHGLPVFAYDPGLRFAVDLEGADDATPIVMSGGDDGAIDMIPFARTRGLEGRLGGELVLYWLGGYGGGVFLPFKDRTSGRETFGGGRYLLDTIKGADLGRSPDGRAILDFNFAYNPSCAYSDRWICPLPPPASALPAAIRAGERSPAG